MNRVLVASPTGKKAEYDEDQLREMWQQGLLHPDGVYWTEGMPDWKPLSHLFESPDLAHTVSSPPPLPTRFRYSYQITPHSLTAFLVFMLWFSLGAEIVFLYGDLLQLEMLSRSFTEAEVEANDIRQGLIGIAYLTVFIVTGIAFLRWIYRTNLNSRAFGAKNMRFTPGWSIGFYFIPIMNLFRPYQAMKEIWQVSIDPENWQSQEVEGWGLLQWWWSLWLISSFLGQWVFRSSLRAETVEDLQEMTMISAASSVPTMLLCIVAICLIKKIASRHERLVNGNLEKV